MDEKNHDHPQEQDIEHQNDTNNHNENQIDNNNDKTVVKKTNEGNDVPPPLKVEALTTTDSSPQQQHSSSSPQKVRFVEDDDDDDSSHCENDMDDDGGASVLPQEECIEHPKDNSVDVENFIQKIGAKMADSDDSDTDLEQATYDESYKSDYDEASVSSPTPIQIAPWYSTKIRSPLDLLIDMGDDYDMIIGQSSVDEEEEQARQHTSDIVMAMSYEREK
jgi:hypothetical protein